MTGQLWRTLARDGETVTFHDQDSARAAAQRIADRTDTWCGVEEWSGEHPQDGLNQGWALVAQLRPRRGWVGYPERDGRRLPPDLTRGGGRECCARHPYGYVCTRRDGHTGRHAAGDSDFVVAVWP